MIRIIHLSDTHFGTEIPEVVSSISNTISSLDPDIIILSGDLTQRARSHQFKAACDFLELLPGKRKLAVPGNHDIPLYNIISRFLTPYANYLKYFPERESIITYSDVTVIGFDATSPYRHTRGKLAVENTREKFKQSRKQITDEGIIIACIHQPIFVSREIDQKNLLIEHEEIITLLSSLGVDLVLSGHIHLPLIASTSTLYRSLDKHFLFAGAGTAISSRLRDNKPNSFNEIVIHESLQQIKILRHDFNSEKKIFIVGDEYSFFRKQEGWIL